MNLDSIEDSILTTSYCLWYTGCVSERYKRNPNTQCAVCDKLIYRRPAELEKSHQKSFCSSVCYGLANRKEKPCVVCGTMMMSSLNKKTCSRSCSNINRSGVKYKIGCPKDKVKSLTALRSRLVKVRGVNCERCGYSKKEILQIHHKDRNKNNNDLNNLVLICPNCHCEDHFLFGKKRILK